MNRKTSKLMKKVWDKPTSMENKLFRSFRAYKKWYDSLSEPNKTFYIQRIKKMYKL